MYKPACWPRALIEHESRYVRWVAYGFSEFFCNYVLLFLGCMMCAKGMSGADPVPHIQVAAAFGMGIFISVQLFSHLSGSHINFGVTITAVILGTKHWLDLPIFLISQMMGATAGYATVVLVTPEKYLRRPIINNSTGERGNGLCTAHYNKECYIWQALIVEFIINALLFAMCAAVWDYKNDARHDSVPLKFGFLITTLATVAGPYSGSNLNPSRTFGPALVNWDWDNHWLWWVGSLSAAPVVGVTYLLLFNTTRPRATDEE